VTVFCLAFNELPFQGGGGTGMSILKAIQLAQLDFEGKRSVSDGLKTFLKRILEKDPYKRCTIEQMKKDEWINEGMIPLAVEPILHRFSNHSPSNAMNRRSSKVAIGSKQ